MRDSRSVSYHVLTPLIEHLHIQHSSLHVRYQVNYAARAVNVSGKANSCEPNHDLFCHEISFCAKLTNDSVLFISSRLELSKQVVAVSVFLELKSCVLVVQFWEAESTRDFVKKVHRQRASLIELLNDHFAHVLRNTGEHQVDGFRLILCH